MIVNLNTTDEVSASSVGNKALSLIKMKNAGFCVPGGFVLDSGAYEKTIDFNAIRDDINRAVSRLTSDNAVQISKEISLLFSGLQIPDEVSGEIFLKISPSGRYAVRSSGIKEDLDSFSFAGQYTTTLNVCGYPDILKAVTNCYRDMFSETVLTYLAEGEISSEDMKMAVIIQDMVDSNVSGVVFTVNPLSGNDKEMVIEAAAGLGENIVSGKVNPETCTFNWYENKWQPPEKNVLLNNKMLAELSETALNIQMFFGYPCDIEFAFFNNRLFILQARAITKIIYGDISDQWTTADFKDGGVSSTICMQYMWSLYEYIWENSLKSFLLEAKILKERQLRKLSDMFFGRPYWNLSVVKTAMSTVPGYKEREFDSDLGVKITYDGDGATTKITPKSVCGILRIALAQKEIVTERRENSEALKKDLLEKYNEYLARFDDEYTAEALEKQWHKLIRDDYLYSEGTYFRQIFINTIHQSLFKDKLMKLVPASGYFELIGGLDNVSHLLPFYDMWVISRKIRSDKACSDFWLNNTEQRIAAELNTGTYSYRLDEIRTYIGKYGYHSEKELDVAYPCYCEDISAVIRLFKDTILLDDSCSPAADRRRQAAAFNRRTDEIRRNVSKRKYKKVRADIDNMRNMLWWREEFRDISTRFYYVIRIYTVKLAEAYVKSGILHDKNDIWFLKIDDIDSFISKKITIDELNSIVLRNRKYYASFRNFNNENEIGSVFSGGKAKTTKGALHGIGCNNGTVTGTARVVENLSEIGRLQTGDILITRFTDTGWTSKFAMLGGIVTEYGGILCHAAIVSREYGIPCIVCTENATKLISDGSRITIDGASGEITVHKD